MPQSKNNSGPDHSQTAVLLRAGAWGLAGLLVLAGLLYGVFWLPYREPHKKVPRIVEILPLEAAQIEEASVEQDEPYTWVDREAEVVRIPVEEAMQLLAGKLPVREDAKETWQESALKHIPTDAGSGRYVRPPAHSKSSMKADNRE